MKKGKTLPEESLLRQKAEAIIEKLNSGKADPPVAHSNQSSTEAEMQKLIHELQVYQIELEMQNEELRQAVEKAATASALYDFAPNGYFTVSPDGTILQLNHSGAKMLGKGLICLENSNLKLFVSDDTKPVFADFLESCFETSLKQTCEISLSVHGEPFSFFYLEGMITEDKNKCLVVAVDITERKRAEESLHESEKMYRLLAGNLPETSVFLFDHDLRFILAEGYLHPEFGFTTSNMEGKALWEVLPQERANRWAPIYKDALEGKPTENLSSEYIGHSYSVNILPVKNKQGEIIAGMVVSHDITKQMQAEEALKANYSLLRFAGQTAKFGGWSMDTADNHVTWSDQVAAIHEMPAGYSPSLDEGINFYAPEWHGKITQVFRNCSEKGIPYDEEMEIITAKGKRVWIRTTGEAFTDSKGKIVKVQGAFQDINERRQADKALRESEEKWRKLVNTIPDYVALYDRDGKYLFLNHFAEGFSMKDIEGNTYTDFLAEESKLTYRQAFEMARQTKTNQYLEHSALGDNRSTRHYESFFVPIFENDQLENMMVIARDITERKQTENDLKKSNSLLAATLESTADGILVVDKMGKVVSFNKKFIELWRFPESVISTHDDKKLMSFVLGQLKDPEGFQKKVDELYLNDEEVSFDSIEFKDGRTYDRYSQAQLFEGKSIGRVWSFRNVTERKQAEAALKTSEEIFNQFLESSPIYIFFKDENIRSLRLSRNFEEMLGKPLGELLGKSMDELFPSDFAKSMVEVDLQILKKGEELTYEEEFNGRFYSTTKFPIQIEGKQNFLAGFSIDITEQRLAEQALKEREASLHELNATKDKFFSIIAHDLKSPFNSIIGFSSLLARQIQERDYVAIEKYTGIIQNSSQQALDLLMNLLEWSRSQTGRMVFSPESIDIVDLINQSTELLNASALQKSITIYSKTPVNLPVFADKAMIGTILRNLISNAIKFTDAGGKIVISTEQRSNELVVSVMDDGVGIMKESIGKLFRIDKNYSTLGTQNEKGTGLGLLLCKEFVDKHGGRIWVESERGKGSRFFFSIPKGI